VRWSPEHSDPDAPLLTLSLTAHEAAAPAAMETPEAAARGKRREALASQRAALNLCERQFAEATRECRQLTDLASAQPAVASERAQALSRAFVDKMLGSQDLCIRLLNEGAGDKASNHAVNVAIVSLLMGRAFGFGEADLLDLGVGAMLHDIGKIDLPERVRHREDDFGAAQAKFYEDHVALGVAHARNMKLSAGATLVIAQHHEHCDGSGFPLHIGSEKITPSAAIVALVDRYDKLCNPRIPSTALTPHEALSLLFAQGQNKFDTAILGAFIKMMGVYPPGSVVQLTDDRYALVVGVNSSRPLKPRVLVHDPKVPANEALVVELERAPNLGIRRSLKPLALPHAALDYLSPRPRVAYFFEPARELAAA
jgi:putative nucleotidyltransferase with HDIG domain